MSHIIFCENCHYLVYLTEMYTIIITNFMKLRSLLSVAISSQFSYKHISALQGLNG